MKNNEMKMKKLEVRIGSRLYYTDTKDYFGKVIKVLKRTVWVEELDGNVTKNFSLNFANNMVKCGEQF